MRITSPTHSRIRITPCASSSKPLSARRRFCDSPGDYLMPGRLVTLVGIGTLALASVGGCSDSAGGPPGSNGVPTASGASGGQTTGGSRGQTTGAGGVSTGGPDSPGLLAGEGGPSSAGVGGRGAGVGEAGTSPHPLAISAQDAVMRVAKVLWNAAPDA